MKRYDIELTVLTPLSVGAGNDNDWMSGADFVFKDGYVHVLDIGKAYNEGIDMDRLSSLFLRADINGIIALLGNKLDAVTKYKFKSSISSFNAIKTFQRSQLYDTPLVAGSSLKGSIRSALFHHLRSAGEEKNEIVFGSMKDGQDFMRFIRVGDIEVPSTMLVNSKIFNLQLKDGEWRGGWKNALHETSDEYHPNRFNTLYECAMPGSKGYGTISIADDAFGMIDKSRTNHLQEKSDIVNGGINELFKIINANTKDYLRKERTFFEEYYASRTAEIIDCIDELLEHIPQDGSSCLLKMSAGVGFHSITGNWQFDDFTRTGTDEKSGKKKYKSRKTAEYNNRLQLMGFVKLRALQAEEARESFVALQESHARIINKLTSAIQEKEKEEKEKILRKQQQAEAERQNAIYTQLLSEAKTLLIEDRLDEAIAKAQEAGAIATDKKLHEEIIEQCKKRQDIQKQIAALNAEQQEKWNRPLKENLQGKTSIGNLLGTTTKWLKETGHTFGEEEFEALVGQLSTLNDKERKKISGKRKDFVNALGEDITIRIFNVLNIS